MADLEAVLADVSYLMAMEKSKNQPGAIANKKILLPDPSVRNIMKKYLEKAGDLTFEKIFNQKFGFLLFKDFCLTELNAPCPQIKFYELIKEYEKLETTEERLKKAEEIYDNLIMVELLNHGHYYSKEALQNVQRFMMKSQAPVNMFQMYVNEICDQLKGETFRRFVDSEKFTRFCQWKNFELNMHITMDDFSVHRALGRGGFGLVSGCKKADTGKMYAMKCMEKKRIKVKQGESLALNERIMLSLASSGDECPFIVCMTYAFQTPDQLLFVLDLMNGGDLHYHLSHKGHFTEEEMKFYAAEVILGLEHMHNRFIVYRDLKPANVLLDEQGHVRISDLGLACDFSKKKPTSTVGTHGYMAPEVLAKGVGYDSSADWYSFGCMLLKLVKGHTQHKKQKVKELKEKDYEKELLALDNPEVDLAPDKYTPACIDLIQQLLNHEVGERIGCRGRGPDELKCHPFFADLNWQQMFLRRYPPPLIPPRGEVNAADTFDIGNFDEDDVKKVHLTEHDNEAYKNFDIVISERWQSEIAESVFDLINTETDKLQMKKKAKHKKMSRFSEIDDEKDSDVILHGLIKKLGGPFTSAWQTRYGKLYPSRLELHPESNNAKPELIFMDQIENVDNELPTVKTDRCIVIHVKSANSGQDTKIVLACQDEISLKEWHNSLRTAHKMSLELLQRINKKAVKIYGINHDPMLFEHNSSCSYKDNEMSSA